MIWPMFATMAPSIGSTPTHFPSFRNCNPGKSPKSTKRVIPELSA